MTSGSFARRGGGFFPLSVFPLPRQVGVARAPEGPTVDDEAADAGVAGLELGLENDGEAVGRSERAAAGARPESVFPEPVNDAGGC